MKKRIIVTGATGFIGRHVLPILASKDWEVHALTSREGAVSAFGEHWHKVNLLDEAEAKRVISVTSASHLLHLAWYAEPGKYWSAPENFAWVTASLGLVEAFCRSGGKRVVVAGTCAEYDWNYGYCRENFTPLVPATIYGTCKNALRQLLTAFTEARNVQLAWGRIFYLYGPHEAPGRLFSSVVSALLRGEEARCTHGNQVRDFLHVADVASAFAALVSSEKTGAFNIASDRPVALREIVERIARELSVPHLLRVGVLPAPPQEPPLIVGDNQLLCGLGWRPAYSLEEGISRTVAWWREQQEIQRGGKSVGG